MLNSSRFRPADDLFERSSMSFGQHLEELRKALIKASAWLGLGALAGMMMANHIVRYVKTPLEAAICECNISKAAIQFEESNGIKLPGSVALIMREFGVMPEIVLFDPAATPTDDRAASFSMNNSARSNNTDQRTNDGQNTEHGSAHYLGADPWLSVSEDTIKRLRPRLDWRKMPTKLTALTATEPFMVWLKASLVAGTVISSPGIFWHLWQFLAAGLYPHERRHVYWYLPLSLALFLSGVCLAFFGLLRLVLRFLIDYAVGMDVEFTPRLDDYMSFALFLPLGFGIAFQLPIVMLGLNRFGVVAVSTFIEHWRMAVLLIAFLSMVLTPQEIYSMIGMFVPLTCLYFLGVFLCIYMPSPPRDPQRYRC